MYRIDLLVKDVSDNVESYIEIFGNEDKIINSCSTYVINKMKQGYNCFLKNVLLVDDLIKSDKEIIVSFKVISDENKKNELLIAIENNINKRKVKNKNRLGWDL